MARAYRVPQKMRICRSDQEGSPSIVLEAKPSKTSRKGSLKGFKIGEPIILDDYACNQISDHYNMPAHLFKQAVVAETCSLCPSDYLIVEFLNIALPYPTNVCKTLIKKLIK